MLAEIKMCIQCEGEERITYRRASIFQSVLMSKNNTEYAEKLHEQSRHPYSQTIYFEDGYVYWVVRTLNREAYNEILLPLLSDEFTSFQITHNGQMVHIVNKEVKKQEKGELFSDFYTVKRNSYIHIQFYTPTAFKQNGKYVFYPDVRLLFQSLMNKYSAFEAEVTMYDEETLNQIAECTEIVQYSLKSVKFPMSGTVIPGFVGEICLKIKGPSLMVNLVNVLLQFGEYAGTGIKTAIGMGAFRIVEDKGCRRKA